jgi:non-ribosomal peptide synthetase component F
MPYLNEKCRLYNYYGPTECTDSAIVHLVTKYDFVHQSVSLGRPMANVHIYLLDEYLQRVIPGTHIGEIVIGARMLYSM